MTHIQTNFTADAMNTGRKPVAKSASKKVEKPAKEKPVVVEEVVVETPVAVVEEPVVSEPEAE